ncbi:abortive infection family protein [Pseudomonas sp. fls2-241-R2A-110]|uniref:abortive infection family protein n=1 Tax=Pseudomonas sp. fls2-241-R2A-110 TaxID=3040311 RepID=UPI0025571285|nr:abortive infection family protein [Pseudomonas sp. fls2-241-R2A-110]
MPLEMAAELRFPMGASTPLDNMVVAELVNLAKRITSQGEKQYIIEKFKENFSKVSGSSYSKSSNLSWAESDLEQKASEAASDAPGFISAFCDTCENLQQHGIHTPTHAHVNLILEKYEIPFRISDNILFASSNYLTPPTPAVSAVTLVERALSDAKALINNTNASSAVDRAHTALHGYLLFLCEERGLNLPEDTTSSKAFKLLREHHPALTPGGPRASEVTRVLQSFAASIDAFSTIRNKASLAHVNELLDEPEATFIINSIYSVFRYIQDRLQRHTNSNI